MKIEKTFIRYDGWMHYRITDNVCELCRHNPKNSHLMEFYVGKCDKAHESVVECVNFKNIND